MWLYTFNGCLLCFKRELSYYSSFSQVFIYAFYNTSVLTCARNFSTTIEFLKNVCDFWNESTVGWSFCKCCLRSLVYTFWLKIYCLRGLKTDTLSKKNVCAFLNESSWAILLWVLLERSHVLVNVISLEGFCERSYLRMYLSCVCIITLMWVISLCA